MARANKTSKANFMIDFSSTFISTEVSFAQIELTALILVRVEQSTFDGLFAWEFHHRTLLKSFANLSRKETNPADNAFDLS